jgi:hypothetical protein
MLCSTMSREYRIGIPEDERARSETIKNPVPTTHGVLTIRAVLEGEAQAERGFDAELAGAEVVTRVNFRKDT